MNYKIPDVYLQDVKTSSTEVQQASDTIGILVGATKSGAVGEPILIGSWTEYIQEFANGLETPFMNNSYLPYSVYGFFANGGSELYVLRVASSSARKATKVGTANSHLSFEAVYEGDIKPSVQIKKNEEWVSTTNEVFDVTIKLSNASDGSVTITEVTKDTIVDAINNNNVAKYWITASWEGEVEVLREETITLEGGNDGITDLQDSDFINALGNLDVIEDASFLAIPGETSEAVNNAVMSYCDSKMLFPMLDMPLGSDTRTTRDYRKSINANGGILTSPSWGYMYNPLTSSNILVPMCGHVMGVYARVISEQGVKKAPAGIDAQIKGILSLERKLTDTDISQLNPVGVVCIVAKPNVGIVIWGARSLNNNADMRYVSSILINYNIKKTLKNATQFAVFEPNGTDTLWSKVRAICQGILETLRLEGALKGSSAEEAYYVICDSSNNTDSTVNEGMLFIDIGYAEVKPAEFIIARISHDMSSQSS